MKQSLVYNGKQLCYYFSNPKEEAPALVLLHGFCEDHRVWEHQWEAMHQHIPLLLIDLPGFGGSDSPLVSGIDQYAEAVCAVLNDAGLSKAVVYGHSMGGYTALELAQRYPERLLGFGILHSHPFADSDEKKEGRRRGADLIREGKKNAYVSQLFPNLFSEKFAQQNPVVLEKLIGWGKEQTGEGIIAALNSMAGREDRMNTLREFKGPVGMVFGDQDQLVPTEWLPEIISTVTTGDVHLLPGIAHMGMYESIDAINTILTDFYRLCLNSAQAAAST